MLCYISNTLDPTYNIATEYYLFHKYDQPVLYLWINAPSIVVGKHQNTLEEINTKFVKDNGIEVCRRISGGGTVYHDEGNLNYTIIAKDEHRKIDYETFSRPIIHALKKMGVEASINSRNSITVDGFKICGHAQYINKNRTMHHGCLLFNSDLTVLEKALNTTKDKISSKGIKSVRATVKNISDFLHQSYTMDNFKQFIIDSVREEYGLLEQISLNGDDVDAIEIIRKEQFTGWDWVYGTSPAFNMKRKRVLTEGDFEVRLSIKQGRIVEIRFYGDFFEAIGITEIETALIHRRYERGILRGVLENIDVTSLFQVTKEVFLDLIID